MIELADERGPLSDVPHKSLTLVQLAERFCDKDEMTRDLRGPQALSYRLFLSRFLVYAQEDHEVMTKDNTLEFRRRR